MPATRSGWRRASWMATKQPSEWALEASPNSVVLDLARPWIRAL